MPASRRDRLVAALVATPGQLRALLSTWRGRFIALFLATQIALPLHYYIGRRDPHDERFAWRMFSPMRMAHCAPSFVLDGRPFDLDAAFHMAWIELAERGRFVVVEDMAAHVCRAHPGSTLIVTLTCSYIDHPNRTFGGHDLCTNPRL